MHNFFITCFWVLSHIPGRRVNGAGYQVVGVKEELDFSHIAGKCRLKPVEGNRQPAGRTSPVTPIDKSGHRVRLKGAGQLLGVQLLLCLSQIALVKDIIGWFSSAGLNQLDSGF